MRAGYISIMNQGDQEPRVGTHGLAWIIIRGRRSKSCRIVIILKSVGKTPTVEFVQVNVKNTFGPKSLILSREGLLISKGQRGQGLIIGEGLGREFQRSQQPLRLDILFSLQSTVNRSEEHTSELQ